jgi:hypothetical protein
MLKSKGDQGEHKDFYPTLLRRLDHRVETSGGKVFEVRFVTRKMIGIRPSTGRHQCTMVCSYPELVGGFFALF